MRLNVYLLFIGIFSGIFLVYAAPSSTDPIHWQTHLKDLSRLENFQLQGKIALKSPKESGSGTLIWKQLNNQYAISIIGPFAGNSLNLRGRPGQIVAKMGNGKELRASSPEELLAKEWGYRLPISNLFYWIRGIPAPHRQVTTKKFDTAGRLSMLIQEGTEIRFLAYTQLGELSLPKKIAIHSADLETKIVIYQWKY